MDKDQDNKFSSPMDRRDFLRYVGAGSTGLSIVSGAEGKVEPFRLDGGEEDLTSYFPGARYLAGPWRFRIDAQNLGKHQQWYKVEPSDTVAKAVPATVPSVWQAHVPGFAGGIGWYFKEFNLPSDFKDRVLRLKFWAVDYFTEVWLNGEAVGNHEGGFTPFEMDITRQAKLEGEIFFFPLLSVS